MRRKWVTSGSGKRRFGLRVTGVATGVAAACAVSVVPAAVGGAHAADFYTPPSTFATDPGSVIRSQASPLLLQIPGMTGQWPGTARKVMYTSRYQDGKPAAVTGTVVEPTAPWRGEGPRPTVVLGSGTIGQGDQCAPSKLLSSPLSVDITRPSIAVNYTAPEMYYMLVNGIRVFVTDYIGMGTPGVHTYVNRAETGQAMLDGARAALAISGAPAGAPVGFAGYSQGGGAAASAAELAETYAPELNVRATYAGAPPADLRKVIPAIDGSTIAGAIGFAINGLTERYPTVDRLVVRETNPIGKAALKRIAGSCIGDIIPEFGFQRTQTWTRTGETLAALIARSPVLQKVVDDQRIGRLTPNAPVFLEGGLNDDVIPHGQVAQLSADWRAKGADVRFVTDPTPSILPKSIINHVVPMLGTFLPGMEFMLSEFNR
ncbi:lipase [Gordonia sp. zg691]|uniref:lipase family protein n=1 Tax=Gordonia jinghuaiqii TaxID=2758710 RepID=UPI0016623339|nr:lipase family protein [Gordonia jinghuaiqii]MBD0863242.1 lipase [Gordonia jinghuaiqii]